MKDTHAWTCGRVVECTGFENRQGRKSLVSSNLTGSANAEALAMARASALADDMGGVIDGWLAR